jgi:hypothetical protein
MLVPAAMVLADRATRQHALSARPQAPTVSARTPRRRGQAMRRLTAVALRRLADHVEPRTVTRRATAAT